MDVHPLKYRIGQQDPLLFFGNLRGMLETRKVGRSAAVSVT